MISRKILERLIQYRRSLLALTEKETTNIYSHELAKISGASPVQVRRDLMVIGYSGSSVKGYEVASLLESLNDFLDHSEKEKVALVGVGYVGRAILYYIMGMHTNLEIVALFDIEPDKINRVIHGCHSYHVNELNKVCKENNIKIGILTVPKNAAQSVAEKMINTGINGIINYAPIELNLPPDIIIENKDMILSVEKVAWLTRHTR